MDPATWAGIIAAVASAASAYSNNRSQKAVKNEREALANMETQRQRQFGEQADQRMAAENARFERGAQEKALSEEQAKLAATYDPGTSREAELARVDPINPGESASKKDLARSITEAIGKGKETARTQGNLSGYGSQVLSNQVALGRSAQDLNRIGSFSAGSSAVLPHEFQGAAGKGERWKQRGDIAQAIAMIASLYSGFAGAAGASGGAASSGSGLTATASTSPATSGSLAASGSTGGANGLSAGSNYGTGFRYLGYAR